MTLLNTDFLPVRSEQFQAFRQVIADSGTAQGVLSSGDYAVTQRGAGPNMSVDVAAGSAWATGSQVVRQGIYHQINDAVINVAIPAAHASLPRVDQIILAINDSSIAGGASDTPAVVCIPGTATAGAQINSLGGTATFRLGAATVANINTLGYYNFIRLADVLTPAAATSIVNANILSRTPRAAGYSKLLIASADSTLLGNPSPYFQPSGMFATLELSAGQVVECMGGAYMDTPSNNGYYSSRWEAMVEGGTNFTGPLANGRANPNTLPAGSEGETIRPVALFTGLGAGIVTVGLKVGYVNGSSATAAFRAASSSGLVCVRNFAG